METLKDRNLENNFLLFFYNISCAGPPTLNHSLSLFVVQSRGIYFDNSNLRKVGPSAGNRENREILPVDRERTSFCYAGTIMGMLAQ